MHLPAYREWLVKWRTKISTDLTAEKEEEEMSNLYTAVSCILQPILESPSDHSSDYNKIAEECAKTIAELNTSQILAAIIYLNAMENGRDIVAWNVARNIRERLQTIPQSHKYKRGPPSLFIFSSRSLIPEIINLKPSR